MKIEIYNDLVQSDIPVKDFRRLGDLVLVIFNYMEFPLDMAARNLFAFDLNGKEVWRAEGIGAGNTDAYMDFLSERPLIVSNFSGFTVELCVESGRVINKRFTK